MPSLMGKHPGLTQGMGGARKPDHTRRSTSGLKRGSPWPFLWKMIRILLVDDSHSVREMLSQRLTLKGYQVSTANDGMMAAEMALASPPDMVLTDLWMPGISGVQLCRLLKA